MLLSKITISAASLLTSVPLPIANPTLAFFKAGASLTPSPVIPTTKCISSKTLTNLLLSLGKALAIIRIFLIFSFNFSSVNWFISELVNTKSKSDVKIPTSLAIEVAVSLLSPVIIIT